MFSFLLRTLPCEKFRIYTTSAHAVSYYRTAGYPNSLANDFYWIYFQLICHEAIQSYYFYDTDKNFQNIISNIKIL